MGVPLTVSASRRIFLALEKGDVPAALACATRAGRKRIETILSTPGDERAVLLMRRNPGLRGRIDYAARRGLCQFAYEEGRSAVLDLVQEEDGVWRIDDVRITT